MHDIHTGQLFKAKCTVPLFFGHCFVLQYLNIVPLYFCATASPPPKESVLHLQQKAAWRRTAVFGPVFNLVYFIVAILKLYLCNTGLTKYYFRSHNWKIHFCIDFKSWCFDFFIALQWALYNSCLAAPCSFCGGYLNYFDDLSVVYIQIGSDKPHTCNTCAKPNKPRLALSQRSTWSP